MKVLITGSTGLVGKRLQDAFEKGGHKMLLASRREPTADNCIQWNAETGFAEPERLEGLDAVVHLAGESVFGLRWTDEKKQAIRDSRVIGIPDERLGEEVKAFVVLKQGCELSSDDFVAWCKTQFAANKYPRYVEFRDELPVGGTGKIFKRALRAEAS
jgi:acyl-CoA synthetase (AMP-forming)/AMP-acid ligase II